MNYKNLIASTSLLALLASCGGDVKNVKKVNPAEFDPANTFQKLTKQFDLIEEDDQAVGDVRDWHHMDQDLDGLYGVSADKAYQELNLQQSKEIIVAVLDSGVDIHHEDLKDVIWTNKKEIPGNGIDDDNNGYIDDMHGWNFIGGKDGSHIDGETLESTRIYGKFLKRIATGEVLGVQDTELFNEVKAETEENLKYFTNALKKIEGDKNELAKLLANAQSLLGFNDFKSRSTIEAITSTDAAILTLKADLLTLWDKHAARGGFERISYLVEAYEARVNTYYNVNFDARSRIVGDNPDDFTDTDYGNNDVGGPDSSHGTHVAGTIAASRNNGVGMNGIAANVKIMALRAVPNGDERDKDIALAVRYAADNGASIINMSFGKGYSPNKAEVDAAFMYAASKGVLLVHAAGNSSKSVDGGLNNFPNSYVKEGNGVYAVNTISNWIEVGASTKDLGLNLPAEFSNFGNEAVTLFAPGHKIYATFPDNKYKAISGTSMACPVTAGVATLLMSEFPTMTASETKAILMHTVMVPEVDVRLPSETAKPIDFRIPVPFADLSDTDGVVNAFTAVRLAKDLAAKK
jgi:subtilisin family serine protease